MMTCINLGGLVAHIARVKTCRLWRCCRSHGSYRVSLRDRHWNQTDPGALSNFLDIKTDEMAIVDGEIALDG